MEVKMSESILEAKNLIGDHWVAGRGDAFELRTPAGDSIVCAGHMASIEQVDEAIDAANLAFGPWSELPLDDRFGIARRFADLLIQKKEELARLIAIEVGKPLWEARTEVAAAAGKVANSIDAILKRRWTTTEQIGAYVAVTRFRPHGAMLVLGPFNLPAHLPGAHIVPALLAGNTIVFKPSELAPSVGQWLAATWRDAGLPNGVLNLVQGAAPVAVHAAQSPAIAGVLFTGSQRAGASLHRALAGQPQKVLALELGGNNPLVVHRCGDVHRAAITVINSAFITSGQRCTCARRLIVVGQTACDQLIEKLKKLLPLVRVAEPLAEPQPFMGSLVHAAAAQSMLDAQSRLIAAGAEAIVSMSTVNDHPAMLSPGLLRADAGLLEDCEHFGPMLTAHVVNDLDEAINLANATQFGLSAGFLGDHVDDFHYFLHRIRAGIVNWNRQTTGASGKLPFGGIGQSGNHNPSGFFASDYCSYPMASLESHDLAEANTPTPGLELLLRMDE
jgi:succinylglutamic semialdehyde dehydrogenase